jgi:uncharacterized membrane protein
MQDPTTPSTPPTAPMSPQDIESGKTMAILSYIPIALIGPIVSIISLAQGNNAFSVFHARQALTLYVAWIILAVCCIPLLFICIGFPLLIAVQLAGLVFCILGLVNASSGQCKRLPLIGGFAEK